MKFLVKNELVSSIKEITPRMCSDYTTCNCRGESATYTGGCTKCEGFCAGKFCHGAGSRIEWM